jgi:hypothetical protein
MAPESPPVEPQPPADNECCGSGCDPCVWDLYALEREKYRAAMRDWQARQAAAGAASKEP